MILSSVDSSISPVKTSQSPPETSSSHASRSVQPAIEPARLNPSSCSLSDLTVSQFFSRNALALLPSVTAPPTTRFRHVRLPMPTWTQVSLGTSPAGSCKSMPAAVRETAATPSGVSLVSSQRSFSVHAWAQIGARSNRA